MNFKIKKILNEFTQEAIIKRIYNMIKDEFFLENGKVRTTIIDLDGKPIIPDSRSGLFIQLAKKNTFAERIVESGNESFPATILYPFSFDVSYFLIFISSSK